MAQFATTGGEATRTQPYPSWPQKDDPEKALAKIQRHAAELPEG